VPHRATEDDDQARWEAPGARGSVPAPFDAYEDPEPVRAGDDEESRRMRRVIVFVVLLACLALAPLLGLALRLSR
jgi:hypothetical protein